MPYLSILEQNAVFGYLWVRIKKNYCHIWNHLPQICLIAKYNEIMEMLKFGTKIAFLGIFRVEF